MMKQFNSIFCSNLTVFGFVLAAIFVMFPLGEAGSVAGQQLEPESNQNRTGYFLQTGLDILPSPGSGSDRTACIYLATGHRFTPSHSLALRVALPTYTRA